MLPDDFEIMRVVDDGGKTVLLFDHADYKLLRRMLDEAKAKADESTHERMKTAIWV